MKVLVIGGGGREHALAWKLARCPSVSKVYAAPGNTGCSRVAECIDARDVDHESTPAQYMLRDRPDVARGDSRPENSMPRCEVDATGNRIIAR